MVKKIRLVEDEVSDEEMDMTDTTKQIVELAKSMDWKLWEMLQIMQRLEKKLAVIDTQESKEAETNEKSKK